jgi:hypothetical protein
LTLGDKDWQGAIDSLEMNSFPSLTNCSIGVDRSFSFRWNGSELSRMIQSPMRWVVTMPFDLFSNIFCSWRFSIMLTNGFGVGLVVWQYSVGHILSGTSVVVTRGVAINWSKIEKEWFVFLHTKWFR